MYNLSKFTVLVLLVAAIDSTVPLAEPSIEPISTRRTPLPAEFTIDTDLTQPVPVIAEDFDLYFERRQMKEMYGTGRAFVAAQNKYGINAVYIMAHAAWESGWGKSKIARKKKNLFGYGAFDASPMNSAWTFDSYADSVDVVMYYVKRDYLLPDGRYWGGAPTLEGMNKKYATDESWKFGIVSIMNRFLSNLGDSHAGR
jgi:beta-N-acetylglucosaminidase